MTLFFLHDPQEVGHCQKAWSQEHSLDVVSRIAMLLSFWETGKERKSMCGQSWVTSCHANKLNHHFGALQLRIIWSSTKFSLLRLDSSWWWPWLYNMAMYTGQTCHAWPCEWLAAPVSRYRYGTAILVLATTKAINLGLHCTVLKYTIAVDPRGSYCVAFAHPLFRLNLSWPIRRGAWTPLKIINFDFICDSLLGSYTSK